MTMIPTTDELLRAARENPEFREEFRRLILTEELLEAPEQLRTLILVTQNLAATGELLLHHADATNERLGGIDERIAELVKGIADYKAATENRLTSIDNSVGVVGKGVKELHGMYSQQHDDYERFRGAYSENSARKDDGVIAGKIARARGNRVRRTYRLSREELTAIFDEAVERDLLDGIDDESQDRFMNADDALLVVERGDERSLNSTWSLRQATPGNWRISLVSPTTRR